MYDSVVEGNGRFVILSNCFNFFNLFLFSTQKTTRDKTFRKRCSKLARDRSLNLKYRINADVIRGRGAIHRRCPGDTIELTASDRCSPHPHLCLGLNE